MKSIKKVMGLLSVCLVVANCYGKTSEEEQVPVIKQTIFVANGTTKNIYGGVYLTNITGKKILGKNKKPTTLGANLCLKATAYKTQDLKSKLTLYNRVIFGTNEKEVLKKLNGQSSTGVVSKPIEQGSGDKELYYKVKPGTSITGKDILEIEPSPFMCQSFLEQARETLEQLGSKVKEKAKQGARKVKKIFE